MILMNRKWTLQIWAKCWHTKLSSMMYWQIKETRFLKPMKSLWKSSEKRGRKWEKCLSKLCRSKRGKNPNLKSKRKIDLYLSISLSNAMILITLCIENVLHRIISRKIPLWLSIDWFLFDSISIIVGKFWFIPFLFDKDFTMFHTIFIFPFLFVVIHLIHHFIRAIFDSHVVNCNKFRSWTTQYSFSVLVSIFELSDKNVLVIINDFCFSLLNVIFKGSNVVILWGF